MKSSIRGFIVEDLNKKGKLVKVPMTQEQREKFDKANKNLIQPEVFLSEFIGKSNFDKANKAIKDALDKSLPPDIKENCLWCLGKTENEMEKACKKYELQAFITLKLMSIEFVDIIRSNPHVFENKKQRFELTIEFYKSIVFYNGKGLMAVDMGKLMGKILEKGLLSINQMLLQSGELSKNLRKINHTIHSLNNTSLPFKINGIEVPEFITLQQDFFKNQQEFYKEEQRLDGEVIVEKAKKLTTNSTNKGRPHRMDIAYYIYYLKETKTLKLQNPFPSDKAWKEIGKLFNRNSKNIQQAYNEISSNKELRLKKSKISILEYVIENMLSVSSKGLDLAKDELNLAKSNS